MSLWNCLEKQLRKITRLKISRIPQSWTKMNVISEFLPCKMRVNMWLMMNDPKTAFHIQHSSNKRKKPPTLPMHLHSIWFLKTLPQISRKCKQGQPFGIFKPLDKRKLIFYLLFGAKEQPTFFTNWFKRWLSHLWITL